MTISIDSNVPVPERTDLPTLPLEEMKVGQSFLLKMDNTGNNKTIQALRQRICRYQNKVEGARFSVRKDEGGMRVFRIE
jgi:hypothetical protein